MIQKSSFTVTQGQRIGRTVNWHEAHGLNNGLPDDTVFRGASAQMFARIIGFTGTFGAYVYTLQILGGGTANGYNPLDWNGTISGCLVGSPGSAGVTIGATGQYNGTTCVVKPHGTTGGYIPIFVVDGGYTFTRDYYAQ